MFGSLIGGAIRLVTLPVDMAEAGMDVLAGGDGSKRSREMSDTPLRMLAEMRDGVAKAAEDLDS